MKSRYNPRIHHRRSIRLKGYDYSKAGLYFITICCQDRIHRFGRVENGEMILNAYGKIAYDEWQKLPERFPHFALDAFQVMPNHIHGIVRLVKDGGKKAAELISSIAISDGADPVRATLAVALTVARHADACLRNNPMRGDGGENMVGGGGNNLVDAGGDNLVNNGGNAVVGTGASPVPTTAASLGDMVGAYKSLVANGCLKWYKSNMDWMENPVAPLGKIWQRNYYEHIIRNETAYTRIAHYIKMNPKNWKEDKFYAVVR